MKASSEEMGWTDDNKEPEGPSDGQGTEMQISRGGGGKSPREQQTGLVTEGEREQKMDRV